jgi:hypothetical protein
MMPLRAERVPQGGIIARAEGPKQYQFKIPDCSIALCTKCHMSRSDHNGTLRPGEKTGGPYYSWTCKRKAKTQTVALSKQQARAFRKAIANNRKLKNIVVQMRQISLHILNATTHGVKKRKPTKNQSDQA